MAFDLIFYLFAGITLIAAFITVFSKNIVYSAFALLFTFMGIVGLYVLLSADFLAITQLLVYVGGILILLIFGVMLTNKILNANIRSISNARVPAAIVALGLLYAISSAIFNTHWMSVKDMPWVRSPWNTDAVSTALKAYSNVQGSEGTATTIGKLFLTDYLLPFEVVSIVLLIALVGAAMIARKEPDPGTLAKEGAE
jgi:NADH-quinone oxidoreductase subunit J